MILLTHFSTFPFKSPISTFQTESFLLEPSLQASTHLKLIIHFQIESPFRVFNSSRFLINWAALSGFQLNLPLFFFFEMSRLFRFSTHYFFLFFHFFLSFHHAFENSKFIQNRCQIQKDNLVKSIVDFNSSKNKLFSLSTYVWSKWTFKVRNVG